MMAPSPGMGYGMMAPQMPGMGYGMMMSSPGMMHGMMGMSTISSGGRAPYMPTQRNRFLRLGGTSRRR